MNLLYPHLKAGTVGFLVSSGALGALIAGTYGIIHDQVTYTLSTDYFTRFKFHQFAFADPRSLFANVSASGDRAFVALIGFLATWWVGLFTGWFLARASIRPDSGHPTLRSLMGHFSIVLVSALVFGLAGFIRGTWWPGFSGEYSADFARVGHIHNFGYLGAAIGLGVALVRVRRERRRLIAVDQ